MLSRQGDQQVHYHGQTRHVELIDMARATTILATIGFGRRVGSASLPANGLAVRRAPLLRMLHGGKTLRLLGTGFTEAGPRRTEPRHQIDGKNRLQPRARSRTSRRVDAPDVRTTGDLPPMTGPTYRGDSATLRLDGPHPGPRVPKQRLWKTGPRRPAHRAIDCRRGTKWFVARDRRPYGVHALDADSGEASVAVHGRRPRSILRRRSLARRLALFGSRDGWVYCLQGVRRQVGRGVSWRPLEKINAVAYVNRWNRSGRSTAVCLSTTELPTWLPAGPRILTAGSFSTDWSRKTGKTSFARLGSTSASMPKRLPHLRQDQAREVGQPVLAQNHDRLQNVPRARPKRRVLHVRGNWPMCW